MKNINTGGISYLEELPGSGGWYWGTDYTSGDLYEAQELWQDGHAISKNRFILVRYPEGRVAEPVKARDGQYFGCPAVLEGDPVILLADFPAGRISLLRYDDESGTAEPIVILPLTSVKDCYNLIPHTSPLCLTRQAENRFQIVWPEKADFPIDPRESFCCREGDRLFFSEWFEDPDYREEVVVRKLPTGRIIDRFPGSVVTMPGGEGWILTK